MIVGCVRGFSATQSPSTSLFIALAFAFGERFSREAPNPAILGASDLKRLGLGAPWVPPWKDSLLRKLVEMNKYEKTCTLW